MSKSSLFFTVALAVISLTACDDIREETYPNGKVRIQAQYVNDKKNGPQTEFYESGVKKAEKTFVDGKEQGEATEYYESGKIKATIPYEHGAIHGTVTRFYENGKTKSITLYEKGTVAEFPESFYENGDPEIQGVYNDPRDGQRYEWVRIGNAVWLAENGKYATLKGSVCMQCNIWGRLYTFEAAKIACPTSFRLPKIADWKALAATVGKNPAKKLKATFGWNDGGDGSDEYSFAVRASGAHTKKFQDAGDKALFWTEEGNVAVFKKNSSDISIEKWNPKFAASLRCVK